MEQLLLTVNMIVHLFVTVAFIGGPFYMLLVTGNRKKMGPDFDYPMDRYLENIIEGQPLRCFIYLFLLVLTGFFFPAIHYLFQGSFKELTTLALYAIVIKHFLILIAFSVMLYMYFGPATKVREIMGTITPDKKPDRSVVDTLFFWRAKRRALCKTIFIIQIGIIIFTAILRFAE
ncbi:MAG: hypothetical protein C4562_05225 [Actinobacteria bacterium]|nr:MAG: hypothetical protein C4562_05225 [Actinomycetota bacterium]